jgi:hypothetical protein
MPYKEHNKVALAAQMFVRADQILSDAINEIDLVTVILLAGAASNIVYPLLMEQGKTPIREILAALNTLQSIAADEDSAVATKASEFLSTYNALKHAGSICRVKKKPSEDIQFESDLKHDAMGMMDDLKYDFRHLEIGDDVISTFPEEFFVLLMDPKAYYPN